jgi:hypothetical protein
MNYKLLKQFCYVTYLGMHESHVYSIYALNLKEAFDKIYKIIGDNNYGKKDKRRKGNARTYQRLPHRKGYPKDMFHYKIAWEPLTVLIRREKTSIKRFIPIEENKH